MSFKSEIAEILTLLKSLRKEVNSLNGQVDMCTENNANIFQTVSDLSRKFDEMINVTGIGTPVVSKKSNENKTSSNKASQPKTSRSKSKAVKTKTSVAKKKLHGNIMTYFRSKFLADQSYFRSIMSEKEENTLFTEHEKDLKSKNGDKKIKAQVGILYKAISSNDEKISLLRSMMEKENDEHLKSQGVEAVSDETDGDESHGSDSDE